MIYTISRFAKPTKKELKHVLKFSETEKHYFLDEDGCETGEYIKLFRSNDPFVANLLNSRFTVPIVLPEIVTDYQRMFVDMGFSEKSIKNDKIHICYSNGWDYDYSDGCEKKRISCTKLKNYDIQIQTECFAIKIKELWNSDDARVYPDRNLTEKYIPELDQYQYVPVNNSILAKAEIPFLIFERNKGKCFLECS